jgi:putative DNA primase/helicase
MSRATSPESGENGRYDVIPQRFKDRDKWLLWDASADTPRRPHWRGNFGVSWNDRDDWQTFKDAVNAAEERDSWGIGYVFTPDDPEYLIDIDGPVDDDGTPREWFPGIERFEDASAYMEWSPSGNGVHIPVEGTPPEKWKDSNVAPDIHQGVDVLTNKFCTFTGDTLEAAGEQVTDTNAAPFLFECYRNLRGEPWFTTNGGESSQYEGDEWLDDDLVEEALGAINPDLPHTEWIKLGYAVHDYDSGSTGKSLFESWSQQGSKWDDAAQRSIDAIWNSASEGSGVTVASLVHTAKEAGWEPPSRDVNPTLHGGKDGSNDPVDWDGVRTAYQAQPNKTARVAATDMLEEVTDWMYVIDSNNLWVYDSDRGFFKSWGEQTAHRILERELRANYTQKEASEILGRLESRNQTRRKELNAKTRDSPLLCVGNGVVNLETGELYDHNPDYKFTRGVEWDYAPDRANPEPVREFLDDVTKREADRDTILDHLGHGLMPGHPYRAFVMMYGPGSNGKTRVGKLLRGFVGEENAAAVELQDLTGGDSFATGALPGAFVNVGDDVSVGEIRDTSIIKSLTGDGTIRANRKYEKQYEFENEAAMFFSANEPPRIREQTEAISDRLYPIEMPYRFVDDDAFDPENPRHKRKTSGIAQALLKDEAAMRGLLVLAVEHAQDVIARNGQYAMPEGPAERRAMYESASDPIKRFAMDHLEEAESDSAILKSDAYALYTEMCDREGERAASEDVFKQKVGEMTSLSVESTRTRKLTPGDNRERAWKYVEFADSATDLMSPKLRERYTQETVPDDDGQTPHDAAPLSRVAQDPTGYATVSVDVLKLDRPDGDSTPALKATVKDETTAIDVVSWDDAEALANETTVLVENAEVTEYNGKTQLKIDEGVTNITPIQSGVAHTEGEAPAENQEQLSETSEVIGAKPSVEKYLTNRCRSGDTVTVPDVAGRCDLDPATAETTLEKIATTTTLVQELEEGWEIL